MAAAATRSRGVIGLLKQGWNEIPEVIGSTGLAIIGLGMAGIGLARFYAQDGNNKRYKTRYTVYRPDDPRAKNIKQ